MAEHLLEVRNLSVEFHTAAGVVKAVKDISWYLDRGETLAILGESGSGKSVALQELCASLCGAGAKVVVIGE